MVKHTLRVLLSVRPSLLAGARGEDDDDGPLAQTRITQNVNTELLGLILWPDGGTSSLGCGSVGVTVSGDGLGEGGKQEGRRVKAMERKRRYGRQHEKDGKWKRGNEKRSRREQIKLTFGTTQINIHVMYLR